MRKWEIKDAQWYAQGIVVIRERKHFRMRSEPCACHVFRFLLIFFRSLLGYLKDCNVSAPSVDSDIFYVVINLFASCKSYIITFIS